jgi:phosphoglycolate phosphatase-like HAD superfamily hydrolase
VTAGPVQPRGRLRAVLVDVDGTLVDSNDAHAQSWLDVLAEAGIQRRFHDVRPLIGMGGDRLLPALTGIESDSEEGKRLSARRWELFTREYLPSLRPFDGVDALLGRFRRDGLTVVVATSAEEDEARALLRVANAEWLMGDATSSSDADASKPAPDIIEAALGRAGASAREAIILGDTPYDLEAAARAGVPAIALRCGGWWCDEDLARAVAIYADAADLLAHYDASPIGARDDGPQRLR